MAFAAYSRRRARRGGAQGAVSIVVTDGRGEITVPSGTFTLTIDGDDYILNTADIIGQPPIILADASIANDDADVSSSITVGDTLTATAGAMVYDPAGGVPALTYSYRRAGTEVETDNTRIVVANDITLGLVSRVVATNGYGASDPYDTDAIVVVPYTEQALVFSGTQTLYKSEFHSADADELLMAVSIRYKGSTPSFGSQLFGSDYCTTMYWSGDEVRAFGLNTAGQDIMGFQQFSDVSVDGIVNGDRLTYLYYIKKDGTRRGIFLLNGTSVRTISGTAGVGGTQIDLTARPTTIGSDAATAPPSSGALATMDYFDARAWINIGSVPDFTLTATQRLFINADGTTVAPTVANATYGTPIIQMPTVAADANALVNNGSNGAWTSKQGTFV